MCIRDSNRATPKVDTKDKLCNRGMATETLKAREGAVICTVRGCACGGWADPLCKNISADDRGGMCIACAKREQRYRKAHNLTRDGEVA